MKCSRKDVLVGVVGMVMLLVSLFGTWSVVHVEALEDEPDFLVTDPYFYHYSAWEPIHALAGTSYWNTSDPKGLLTFNNTDHGGLYCGVSLLSESGGWAGSIYNEYRNQWYPAFYPPHVNEHGNALVFQGQFPHSNTVLGNWAGDYWIDYPCPENTLMLEFTVENVKKYPSGPVSHLENPEEWMTGSGIVDSLGETLFPFVSVGVDVFFDMEPDVVGPWTYWDYDDPDSGGEPDLAVIDVFPIHYIDTTGSPNGGFFGFEYPLGIIKEMYNWTLCDLMLGYTNPYQGMGAYDTDEHYSIAIDMLPYGEEKTYMVDLGLMFNALVQQCQFRFFKETEALWECSGAYIKAVCPTMEAISCEYAGKVKYVQVYYKDVEDADVGPVYLWCRPYGDCPYVPEVADVVKDGKIRTDDIFFVSTKFGGEPGHDKWDPEADVTCDGKIRVDDIMYVALLFGTDTGWGHTTITLDGVDITTVIDDCTCCYGVHDCSVEEVRWLEDEGLAEFISIKCPATLQFRRSVENDTVLDDYEFWRWRQIDIYSGYGMWLFSNETGFDHSCNGTILIAYYTYVEP